MLLGRLFACHKSDNIIKNSVSGKMLRPTCHLQLESPLLSQGGPSVAIVINIAEASRSNCVFVFIKFCWLKPLIISSVDTENIIIVCTSMLNWGGRRFLTVSLGENPAHIGHRFCIFGQKFNHKTFKLGKLLLGG